MVLLFTAIGGMFAASEIALVTLRETQIESMAARSKAGRKVKELTKDSNRFLSAVQIGVTLAGFFSASFGASQISPYLEPVLEGWGMSPGAAGATSFIGITLAISYLSIVFGELVPKRLAMQSAEAFSLIAAYPLSIITTLLRPVIWFLGVSVNTVLRLLGRDPDEIREDMDAEELRGYIAGFEAIPNRERRMVVELLSVGERTVAEIMTPRTEIEFLDAGTRIAEAQRLVTELGFSRYPIRGETEDDVLGFIHIRDLINPTAETASIGDLVRPALFFPEQKSVMSALTELRAKGTHLAIVVDEYGGTDGLITLEDAVEEFVGEIQDEYDPAPTLAFDPAHGGEVPGLLGRADFHKHLGRTLPDGSFDTLAGFMVMELGHLPKVGESVTFEDLRLTVKSLDGRRIDRVTIEVEPDASTTTPATTTERSRDD